MTSLEELVSIEMSRVGDSWCEFVDCTATSDEIREPFEHFGPQIKSAEDFILWTEKRVYFRLHRFFIFSLPRNPFDNTK